MRSDAYVLLALFVFAVTLTAPLATHVPDTPLVSPDAAARTIGASGGDAHAVIDATDPITVGIDASDPKWARLKSVTTVPIRPRLAGEAGQGVTSQVAARETHLRIDVPAEGALDRTLADPGVVWATRIAHTELLIGPPEDQRPAPVAFVDPDGFRHMTPRLSAASQTLWDGLREGEALLTHSLGARLGLEPGSVVRIGEQTEVRVAGWLSLGRSQVGDVLLHSDFRDEVAGDAHEALLVSLRNPIEAGDVAARLADQQLGFVAPPPTVPPYLAEIVGGEEATRSAIEPFTFFHKGGGRLDIDRAWVERHIVKTTVPIIGEVTCHRLIIPQLRAALGEIAERDLAPLLDPDDYGGCWVPRHIGWDERRPLSMHAWGLAFDFNVQSNLMGQVPELDPRVVTIFERHGFNWGGRWRRPDGMHFELGRLLDDPADDV